MSRTVRRLRPLMKLRARALRKTTVSHVRDGTPQHVSVSCRNHGGCPICEGNRLHKHRKRAIDPEYTE